MYKVPHPPPPGGKSLSNPLGEEFQVVKKEREFNGLLGRISRGKKGKGKQYHLFYDIRAVGKRGR